jgi:hypothetical protein
MIGGIRVFLPHSPVEANEGVANATIAGGKLVEIVKKEEEMEQTLMFSPVGEEEHSTKMLKIFSHKAKQEMTVALKLAAEEEADNMDFVHLCEELEPWRKV